MPKLTIDSFNYVTGVNNVSSISCAQQHTIFVLRDGTVKVCGNNNRGQLGTGDKNKRLSATDIPGLTQVKSVSTSMNGTLFLMQDGSVKECGVSFALDNFAESLTPIQIPDLINVKSISRGQNHSMFVLNDGTIKVYGDNSYGELRTGDFLFRRVPTTVS